MQYFLHTLIIQLELASCGCTSARLYDNNEILVQHEDDEYFLAFFRVYTLPPRQTQSSFFLLI